MIVFELAFPNRGSWNNKWSGDGEVHARVYQEKKVPKHLWDKDFFYRWSDGWVACITTKRVPAKEANKYRRNTVGLCGYDWMVKSIIEHGEIRKRVQTP